MKVRFNIYISFLSIKPLQQIALKLGYIQDRGPLKGQGSISQLVEAIANRQVTLQKEPHNDDSNLRLVPPSTGPKRG